MLYTSKKTSVISINVSWRLSLLIYFTSIFSSGFAESGAEGKVLQKQIADLANESGMGVCGPNCQGSVSLKDNAIGGFSASLGVKPLLVGPIGYVTQSGALGYSIFSLAQAMETATVHKL